MIDVPELKRIADVFLFNWTKGGIEAKLDHISERGDGVSGELLIKYKNEHVYHGKINLISPQSKNTLVKSLSSRVNHLDWGAVIEQIAFKTLDQYRIGEPVVQLGTLAPRTTPRYRLYPFILEGERVIFYGFGGSGKSKLSQFMALMVQNGLNLMGMTTVKGNTLILDWESSAHTVDEWLKACRNGLGMPDLDLPLYRYCTRGLQDDIESVQQIILDNHIELIIVDSVGMAIGGDAESQDMARTYFNALRSLKIASISIDHKAKKGKGIYGSVYKENIARATFEFRAHRNEASPILNVGIFNLKANDTPIIQSSGFKLEIIGDEDYIETVEVSQQDTRYVPEIDASLSQRQQIINFLKEGAKEVKEIAEELGIAEGTVRVHLNRNKQTFVKTDGTKWGLLSVYDET